MLLFGVGDARSRLLQTGLGLVPLIGGPAGGVIDAFDGGQHGFRAGTPLGQQGLGLFQFRFDFLDGGHQRGLVLGVVVFQQRPGALPIYGSRRPDVLFGLPQRPAPVTFQRRRQEPIFATP